MNDPKFQPGFRLSTLDIGVLIAGEIGSVLVGLQLPVLGAAIIFVVAHFVLFCNVIRMARPLEFVWATVFAATSGATALTGFPGWPATFVISLVATSIVVAMEMQKPSYHGILWQQINPRLPKWWIRHCQTVKMRR